MCASLSIVYFVFLYSPLFATAAVDCLIGNKTSFFLPSLTVCEVQYTAATLVSAACNTSRKTVFRAANILRKLLKHNGNYRYRQQQHSQTPFPPAHAVCVCVSHKMAKINTHCFPNSISQLGFVIELYCVYCEVGSEVLCVIMWILPFNGWFERILRSLSGQSVWLLRCTAPVASHLTCELPSFVRRTDRMSSYLVDVLTVINSV